MSFFESTPDFQVERLNSTVIVSPQGDLGEFTFARITAQIQMLLDQFDHDQCVRNLIVDFERTDYFGSAALGLLVDLHQRVVMRGGQMILCNISPHECEILRLTRLDRLWPVMPNRDQALMLLKAPGQTENSCQSLPLSDAC